MTILYVFASPEARKKAFAIAALHVSPRTRVYQGEFKFIYPDGRIAKYVSVKDEMDLDSLRGYTFTRIHFVEKLFPGAETQLRAQIRG